MLYNRTVDDDIGALVSSSVILCLKLFTTIIGIVEVVHNGRLRPSSPRQTWSHETSNLRIFFGSKIANLARVKDLRYSTCADVLR